NPGAAAQAVGRAPYFAEVTDDERAWLADWCILRTGPEGLAWAKRHLRSRQRDGVLDLGNLAGRASGFWPRALYPLAINFRQGAVSRHCCFPRAAFAVPQFILVRPVWNESADTRFMQPSFAGVSDRPALSHYATSELSLARCGRLLNVCSAFCLRTVRRDRQLQLRLSLCARDDTRINAVPGISGLCVAIRAMGFAGHRLGGRGARVGVID